MVSYNLIKDGVVAREFEDEPCFSALNYVPKVSYDEVRYFCPTDIEPEIKKWFLKNAQELVDFKIVSRTKNRITFNVIKDEKTLSALTLLRYLDKNENTEYGIAYSLIRKAYELREHSSFINVLFAAHLLHVGPTGYGHTIAATGNMYHYTSLRYYLPRQENLKDFADKVFSVHSFFGNKEFFVDQKNELVKSFKNDATEGFKKLEEMLK